jgi:cytidylate kinase
MKEQTREEPKIMAAAERQMQAWSLTQEIADRTVRLDESAPPAGQLRDFITISREAGAGGGHVAEFVGKKLGWEVLDKGLLDRVADRSRLPRESLTPVDETSHNWAYDVLGPWLDSRVVSQDKYVTHLSRIFTAAARRGNVVLVGRGAQFVMPRDQGLAVRIIASEKYRVKRIMEREGVDARQASRVMKAIDHGRRQFVQFFFHHDIADPHFYDMVLNVETLGPARVAEQIVNAYRE